MGVSNGKICEQMIKVVARKLRLACIASSSPNVHASYQSVGSAAGVMWQRLVGDYSSGCSGHEV